MSYTRIYPPQFQKLKRRLEYFINHDPDENPGILCGLCDDVLVEPHQLVCGCRFCFECVKNYITNCQRCCPGCKDVVESIERNIIYDKAAEKEIFELQIKCINKGCNYVCKLRYLVDHLEECKRREMVCDLCEVIYPLKNQEEHQNNECLMRTVTCVDCGIKMTKEELDRSHRNVDLPNKMCDNWKGFCPNQCSNEVYESIKEHLQNCSNAAIECGLKYAGCTKMFPRTKMADHMNDDVLNHTLLLFGEVIKVRSENVELRSKSSESLGRLRLEIEKMRENVVNSSLSINNLKERIQKCDHNHSLIQNHAEVIKQSLDIQGCPKTVSQLPKSFCRTYHGEYLWKIDGIREKITDAKSGVNVKILSDPFYTGSPGYQISLKIYPNGDGSGLGKYVSIYFVIMKGDYDEEISWPFSKKVSLCLLSTRLGMGDITVNMKPDDNDQCYGRPTKQYNLAAGQPRFISHRELLEGPGFVSDGGIVVRARVL